MCGVGSEALSGAAPAVPVPLTFSWRLAGLGCDLVDELADGEFGRRGPRRLLRASSVDRDRDPVVLAPPRTICAARTHPTSGLLAPRSCCRPAPPSTVAGQLAAFLCRGRHQRGVSGDSMWLGASITLFARGRARNSPFPRR